MQAKTFKRPTVQQWALGSLLALATFSVVVSLNAWAGQVSEPRPSDGGGVCVLTAFINACAIPVSPSATSICGATVDPIRYPTRSWCCA